MTFASLSFRPFVPTSISARPASRRLWLKLVVLALAVLALLGGSQQAKAQCSSTPATLSAGVNSPVFSLVAGDVLTFTFSHGTVAVYNGVVGNSVTQGTVNSSGTYTIPTTGSYFFVAFSSSLVYSCGTQTVFTVTTTADDATGVAANCATGSTTACTLRDALAAAAASTSTGLLVNFSPTVFTATNTAAQNTIQLGYSAGSLTVPANTTIQGATSGSGASLTNLVTVSGNGATVFNSPSGTVVINNLMIENGLGGNFGGGINNGGTLTLNQDTVSGNSASQYGGGVYNTGTLTVTKSTFSGNHTTYTMGGGGAICSSGTLTISNSTFTGNTTAGNGGGIYLDAGSGTLTQVTIVGNSATGNAGGIYIATGTPTINESIVAANSAASYADIEGSYLNPDGDDVARNFTNGTYPLSSLAMAPLGYYGGPTQTMPLLPSSPIFCINPFNSTTDQRGVIRMTNYFGLTCNDPGATNSNYSIAFTTQPTATYNVGVNFLTMPVVSFEDDGYVLPYTSTGGSVSFSDSLSLLAGTKTGDFSAGSVTPTGANIPQTATNDTLTAKYNLTQMGSTLGYLSATSTAFNVVSSVTGFTISALPTPETAGTAESVTVTALNGSSTATQLHGHGDVYQHGHGCRPAGELHVHRHGRGRAYVY